MPISSRRTHQQLCLPLGSAWPCNRRDDCMKTLLKYLIISSVFTAAILPVNTGNAQTVQALTPLPDPRTPTAPTAPSAAKESYDERAIEQIMKIVDLTRSVGGGLLQLLVSAQTQEKALEIIRDANTGTKTFPIGNSGTDIAAREGGLGLKEMADSAIAGSGNGPVDFTAALSSFRPLYLLDKAFALASDTLSNNIFIGNLAASGAVTAATGEDSYKRANASMKRIDVYILALQASQDMKTSLDINTRVQIETVQQLNEMLRTQSAIATTIGAYFMALGGTAAAPDTLLGLKNFNR
jgi:Type IV secretion system proteins